VNNLFASVTSNPDVLGFVWFDYDKDGVDWRLESRPAVRAVFDQDISGLQLLSLPG
jgi:hypothetical protein